MLDAKIMTVFNGGYNLEEGVLDEGVLAQVDLLLRDHGEEVTIRAEVEDDENPILFFEDAVERDDTGVGGCKLVQGDFAALELPLARVEVGLGKTFDGVPCWLLRWGGSVEGEVDHPVGAGSQDGEEFEPASIDTTASKVIGSGVDFLGHG